jgi:hypothetical protein
MKTSNLQCILSVMETLTDELCGTDHDWGAAFPLIFFTPAQTC